VLHQGRIERFFLDHMKKHSNDTLRIERAVLPETLHIDDSCDDHSPDNYPITVQLRYLTEEEAKPAQSKGAGVNDGLFRSNLAEDDTDTLIAKSREKEGSTETVKAKYMVGCDGAHSWTRGQLGFKLEGEPTDYIWGVLGESTLSWDSKTWMRFAENLVYQITVANTDRYHSHHQLPRHPHALRRPQRIIRFDDGHPSREQASPILHPAY
jgi:flavin-dependent dehydrogenase